MSALATRNAAGRGHNRFELDVLKAPANGFVLARTRIVAVVAPVTRVA